MAENYKLEIDRGATYRDTVTYADPDGVPIDLTGGSAVWTFKRARNDAETPALELTDGDGLTLGDALGTVELTLTPEQTFAMNGEYVHDLVFTSDGGEVERLVEGAAIFRPGVYTP